MKPMFLNFNKSADLMITNQVYRGRIIAAALAQALANLSALPSTEVETPSQFFNSQVLPQLRIVVSVWNEAMVFDARTCIDHVRAFWMLRYTAAHPTSRPVYALNRSFFESVIGVSTFIASDTAEFFEENKEAILFLSAVAAEIAATQMRGEHDA